MFTGTAEEAMWQPRRGSHVNSTKTKVIDKIVRYTNILEAPIPKLLNEVGDKLISIHGHIIITFVEVTVRTKDIHETSLVSWRQACHFRGQVHQYCEHESLVTARITRHGMDSHYRSVHDGDRQRIHCETYCQVRCRMLGHCFNYSTQRQC